MDNVFAFLTKFLDNVHDFLMNIGWAWEFFKFSQRIVQRECTAFAVGAFYKQLVLIHD